jgi:hypothetical protein
MSLKGATAMGEPLTPGFDLAYTMDCFEENLRPIAEDYFRARLVDEHCFPFDELGERAIILLPNHSGMGLSWDNIILDFLVYDLLKRRQGDAERAARGKVVRLVDPILITRTFVRPFGIDDWWTRIGCVPATFAQFEQAVRDRKLILLSPEGVAGIAKGYHRRYQLQRYSTSFLALAHRYGATVVPISVVNAEYLRPFAYCVAWVNRLIRKIGMSFLPLGLGMLELLFPATYMNVLPSKLTYVLHEPVRYGVSPSPVSRDALRAEADAFRARHQDMLRGAVAKYHAPYALKELWSRFLASPRKRAMLPFLWHELFLRTAGMPWVLAFLYKIPLGYPLVWLARSVIRRARRARALPAVRDSREVSHVV